MPGQPPSGGSKLGLIIAGVVVAVLLLVGIVGGATCVLDVAGGSMMSPANEKINTNEAVMEQLEAMAGLVE